MVIRVRGFHRNQMDVVVSLIVIAQSLALGACESYHIDYVASSDNQSVELREGIAPRPFVFDGFEIDWGVAKDALTLHLKNTGSRPVTVIWDEAVFVDPNGESSGVVHKGIRKIFTEMTQPPSIVLPGTFLDDAIIPKIDIVSDSSPPRPIIPNQRRLEDYVGKTFSVRMVFEIDKEHIDKLFRFRVERYSVESPMQSLGKKLQK